MLADDANEVTAGARLLDRGRGGLGGGDGLAIDLHHDVPGLTPARAAGLPFDTSVTAAPRVPVGSPSDCASSGVTVCSAIPDEPPSSTATSEAGDGSSPTVTRTSCGFPSRTTFTDAAAADRLRRDGVDHVAGRRDRLAVDRR